VCVCVCARACVRACVRAYVYGTWIQKLEKISENAEITEGRSQVEWQEENARLMKEVEKNNKIIEQLALKNADQTNVIDVT